MSRTVKGGKAPGYDFWTARPGNRHGLGGHGPDAKKQTKRTERQLNKKEARDSDLK